MHEFSIIQNLFSIIAKEAAQNHINHINKVTVHIGELRQLVPDFLQFAFTTIAQGTISEGAQLNIEIIPGQAIILESIEGEQ